VALNRSAAYLQVTEARDARALWVNPAGTGNMAEASVHIDFTVDDPGARGRLRQLTAGFSSRGLSFAYQRDNFDSGLNGHTYRFGLAGASGTLALGGAVAYYRGGTSGVGWDLGVKYGATPTLMVGAVVANIGQPVVRGLRQSAALIAGVSVAPVPPIALSVSGRTTADQVVGYSFSARWLTGGSDGRRRWPLGIIARLDTDERFRRGAFAFGVSLGGRDEIGTVATTPGDLSSVEAVSLYGVSTRGR
jgi:hypothetical protein